MGLLSMKSAAQELKQCGVKGDTDLVHVNEREKAILKAHGGSGTRNPHTGLLQYEDGGDGGEGGDSGGASSSSSAAAHAGRDGEARGISTGMGGLSGGGLGISGMRGDGLASNSMMSPGAHLGMHYGNTSTSGQQANPTAARDEAWGYNDSLKSAGLIGDYDHVENQRAILDGRIKDLAGPMSGTMAETLTQAYSPRTTGLLSMVKNMFTTPEKVDTPYTALNSLISSGYAAPSEDGTGFKATPKAAWDSLKSFVSPFAKIGATAALGPFGGIAADGAMKGVNSAMGNDTLASSFSPTGLAGGLLGMAGYSGAAQALGLGEGMSNAIGIGSRMRSAGIAPARSSGTSGDSVGSRGGGRDNGLFNADAQYAESLNSPLVSGSTIDPAAWFAARRAT